MSNIDRKACFQKQLLDMSNAVDALETDVENVYTKEDADEKFQTIEGMSAYALKDYIHQITLYIDDRAKHCFLTFNIKNDVSTPYTTANQVYNALIAKYGENKFIGGNGYYQVADGYKEILFNISTRSNTDYILDADYFEVDANFDSGNESVYLDNFQVKDIIL